MSILFYLLFRYVHSFSCINNFCLCTCSKRHVCFYVFICFPIFFCFFSLYTSSCALTSFPPILEKKVIYIFWSAPHFNSDEFGLWRFLLGKPHISFSRAQWSRTTKNLDKSTRPLSCLFALSLVTLTHLLATHCSHCSLSCTVLHCSALVA